MVLAIGILTCSTSFTASAPEGLNSHFIAQGTSPRGSRFSCPGLSLSLKRTILLMLCNLASGVRPASKKIAGMAGSVGFLLQPVTRPADIFPAIRIHSILEPHF
jgi:hypothetical protein